MDLSGLEVFKKVAVDPAIIITQKTGFAPQKQEFLYTPVTALPDDDLDEEVNIHSTILDETSLCGPSWALVSKRDMEIFQQMRTAGIHLQEYLRDEKIYYGIKTGLNKAFIIEPGTLKRISLVEPQSVPLIHRLLLGRDILRFNVDNKERFLINIPKGWTRAHCGEIDPEVWMRANHSELLKHLEPYTERAQRRQDKGEFWWELRVCEYLEKFQFPKIIYPDIAENGRFTLDNNGCFLTDTSFFIVSTELFLLGVLNSTPIFFFF